MFEGAVVGGVAALPELPLPPAGPVPVFGARPGDPVRSEQVLTAVVHPTGELVLDAACDPVGAEVRELAARARVAIAAQAATDARTASAYVWGAAEFAARLGTQVPPAEAREWGARGMLTELAVALRIPEGTLAGRLARITRLQTHLPRLWAAHLRGEVSGWHTSAVLDVLRGVADPLLSRADVFAAERAPRLTAPALRSSIRGWRDRNIPSTPERRAARLADRRVEVTPADEDMVWLVALVPAAQGRAIDGRLDAIAEHLREDGDTRTRQQARADVLMDALLGADAADAPDWVQRVKPELVLTVPVLTLLGHGDEPAVLEGVGPIDLETATRLAAHAPSFTRVLTDPESGAVLSVGRSRYRIPADLRRAVRVRDGHCRFPSCQREDCDVDHLEAWEDGGETSLDNLASECRKHHRDKHVLGWRPEAGPNGLVTWTSPAGLVYFTEPADAWPAVPALPPRPPEDAAGPVPGYPDIPPF